MKKINLNKALHFNKEVVSKLQEAQLVNIKGGLANDISCMITSCNSNQGGCNTQ